MAITRNVPINLGISDLILVKTLDKARHAANASDHQGHENDGTYGLVKKALLSALAKAIEFGPFYEFTEEESEQIAERLYDEAIDNGEDITYQIYLWNTNQITVEA